MTAHIRLRQKIGEIDKDTLAKLLDEYNYLTYTRES
jgi:hypothetical protein